MDIGPYVAIVSPVLGLVIGFCIGLTGVGGGVLVVPALVVILRIEPAAAVATASFYSVLVKIYGTFQHARLRNIDYRPSLLFLSGAVPGLVLTAATVKRYAEEPVCKYALLWVVLGVIVLAGVLITANLWRRRRRRRSADAGTEAPTTAGVSRWRQVLGVVFGFLVGCLMGPTGIGGGVMVIPVLVICLGLSMTRTVGSSLFVAVVLMFFNTLVYALLPGSKAAEPGYWVGILMAVGSLVGVWAGSRLALRIAADRLQAIVIVLILLALGMQAYKIATFEPEAGKGTAAAADPAPSDGAALPPTTVPE